MPAPVLPSELRALVPDGNTDACVAFKNLIAFIGKVTVLEEWMFTANGNLSPEFLALAGATGIPGLPVATPTTTPPAPSNCLAISMSGFIRVKSDPADASYGVTGYNVWRRATDAALSGDGSWTGATQIGTSAAQPYDDHTAAEGITYFYRLVAVNAKGTSPMSNSSAAAAGAATVGGVTTLYATTPTWVVPGDATEITLEVWAGGGNGPAIFSQWWPGSGNPVIIGSGGGGGGAYKKAVYTGSDAIGLRGQTLNFLVGGAREGTSISGGGVSLAVNAGQDGSNSLSSPIGGLGGSAPPGGVSGQPGNPGGPNTFGTGGESGNPAEAAGKGGNGSLGTSGNSGQRGQIKYSWKTT